MSTAERFQHDTRGHVLTIVKDDGVHRHLNLRNPECFGYWYEVITWPGALCIDGDCGSFVFRRVPDMFAFFRDPEGRGRINPSYWAEKVTSREYQQTKEWDPEGFQRHLIRNFRDWWYPVGGLYSQRREAFKQLREEVLAHAEDEHSAMSALHDYEFTYDCAGSRSGRRTFQFSDAWEMGVYRYRWDFLWCLHAIVHAIAQYDAHHEALAASKAAA